MGAAGAWADPAKVMSAQWRLAACAEGAAIANAARAASAPTRRAAPGTGMAVMGAHPTRPRRSSRAVSEQSATTTASASKRSAFDDGAGGLAVTLGLDPEPAGLV